MKYFKLLFIIIACANIFAACKKDKTEPTELSKLPAATQIGAKTFGCLVNGIAFVPDNGCTFLCTPAFRANYDNSNGGFFYINAELINSDQNIDKHINFGLDSCINNRLYNMSTLPKITMSYFDYKMPSSTCQTFFSSDINVIRSGYVNLTKCDFGTGIISGMFEFKIERNGCETINITNGRFDAKL